MEQQFETVTAAGGSIVAIAVTATFSQQRFAAELDASYPLLSDWNRDVSSAWGVAYNEWKGHRGLAKRSVFVIDGDGVVCYRWVTDDALELPDLEEAVAVLREVSDGGSVNVVEDDGVQPSGPVDAHARDVSCPIW